MNKKENKFYTSYSKLSEVKLIKIGLASPEIIKLWAEKILPNGKILGEVINANTVHHKTFKPQKGGLFCERIFGPLKDFECACGKPLKYKKDFKQSKLIDIKTDYSKFKEVNIMSKELNPNESNSRPLLSETRKFCNICEVEYTWSVMRRYQLGYIKLVSPITHVWYLKGNPSYLSILLDIKKKHLEYITYCSETITLENSLKKSMSSSEPSDIVSSWKKIKEEIINQKEIKKKLNEIKSQTLDKSKLITSQINSLTESSKVEVPRRENIKNLNEMKQNKIEKRKKLILKKEVENWKKLFLLDLNENIKEFKKNIQIVKSLNQNYNFDSNDVLTINFKTFKNYTKNFKLKNLKILSFLISQSKKEGFTNLKKIKQIYKKLNIPYYILLNLNTFSQQSIYTNLIDTTWKKLIEIALKKTLNKINQIDNQLNKSLFMNNWLLLNNDTIFNENLNDNDFKTIYSLLLKENNFTNIINLNNFKFNESIKNKNLFSSVSLKPNLKNFGGIENKILLSNKHLIFLIKNYFYNNFFNHYFKNKKDGYKLSLNKKLYFKSHFYLELYTLSNFSNKINEFIISDFLNKSDFRINLIKIDNYKLIINNLNKVFFNILIQNFYGNLNTINNNNSKLNPLIFSTLSDINNNKIKNSFEISYKDLLVFKENLLKNIKEKEKMFNLIFTKNSLLTNILSKTEKITKFNKEEILLNLKLKKINKKDFKEFKNFFINDLKKECFIKLNNYSKLNYSSKSSLSQISSNNLINLLTLKSNDQNNKITSNRLKKLLKSNLLINNNNLLGYNFKNGYRINSDLINNLSSNIYQLSNDLNINEKFTNSNLIKKEDKFKKKIYNPIYCLSHKERWEGVNDWNFLYYFITAPLEKSTKIISNYKELFSFTNNNFNLWGSSNLEFENNNVLSIDSKLISQNLSLEKSAYFSGPGIVKQLLNEFTFQELRKIDKQNRFLHYILNKEIVKLKKVYFKLLKGFITGITGKEKELPKDLKKLYQKRDLLLRRTKLIRKLVRKQSSPQSTILTVLPVLPPDLRPIIKMGDQIAASDLNRLYQRVIYRNDRLKKFIKDPTTSYSHEMKYAQRLLQEAVDNLIQNGKTGVLSEKDSRGRALKSLSDLLKGKQGRFRQYLLGKRVDYSGRSVIVVGPKLKLHECGIPKEMALELYLPFLLKTILNENLSRTVVGAKTLIKTNPILIWELLREIMKTCPVLLNRAPTLHRLGIQAFQPKLVDGRAILLHPLVCSAFNADFDGDQMAVHIPITVEARAEAWKLMLSRNNILSPATGEPLAIPSQDMVLGCYYLTTNLLNTKLTTNLNYKIFKGFGFYYSQIQDVIKDYQLNKIYLHSSIWLKWNGFIENGSDQEEPVEIRLDKLGNWKEIYNKSQRNYDFKNNIISHYILTTPGKIIFNQIIQQSIIG